MIGVSLLDVMVGTKDLRQALSSVVVHAGTDAAEVPQLAVVRLYVDRENILVAATDRYTAAVAVVSVWESDPGAGADGGTVDLWRSDVAKILAVFHAGKAASDQDEPEWQLRIQVQGTSDGFNVRFTDVSGLIPGETLILPGVPPHDHTPNVPELVGQIADRGPGVMELVQVTPKLIGRFTKASAAYNDALLLQAVAVSDPKAPAPLLVQCGESFIGVVMPRRIDDEDRDRFHAWLAAHKARLTAWFGRGRTEES